MSEKTETMELEQPPAEADTYTFDADAARVALFAALAWAQAEAKRVPKTRQHERQKWKYASSDDMIDAAKMLLGNHGLAVIPTGMDWTEAGPDAMANDRELKVEKGKRYLGKMARRFLVVHEAGGAIECSHETPVWADGNKAAEKIHGAADSASLASFLRSLLCLAKGDDDGSTQRNTGQEDRTHQPPRSWTEKGEPRFKAACEPQGYHWPDVLAWLLKKHGRPWTWSSANLDQLEADLRAGLIDLE